MSARHLIGRFLLPHRWPLIVWLGLLGAVLLIRFPIKFLLDPPYLMDFEVFRTTALRILQGDAHQLFAPVETEHMFFKYSPWWALLITPLGWMSSHAGAVVWSGLNVLCLLGTCWVTDRLCRHLDVQPPPFVGILAVLMLVRPITSEFLLGQTNLLWGLLIAGAVLCDVRHRAWAAAGLLALAISLKLPALIFLAYFTLMRRWRMLGRVAGWLLLLNGVAAAILLPQNPVGLLRTWIQTLLASGSARAFEIGNQSLLSLLGRLLRNDGYRLNLFVLPDATIMLIAAGLELVLFLLLFLPSSRRNPSASQTICDGALLTTLMVLSSPTCWIATYNALLMPVMLLLGFVAQRPRLTWTSPAWTPGLALLFLCSLMMHAKFWRFLGVNFFRGESYVYLVLMVFPWFGLSLGWCLWKQRRELLEAASGA
ncbi:MAG: hypothetical protein COV75_08305 [Candidatus Omnitrophica bacterium CG11_big_fil_rev_8_21_14_0_20_63_9]|nr:MAG: hypothetical protein COV75_08305 [Candidatus Omnitrophica bacterium CG11_big_fil_rev_8_21_14_0_20_63_9]